MGSKPSESRPGAVSRRGFVKGVGAGAVLVGAGALPEPAAAGPAQSGDDLFSLGVASGDPLPSSVVLWTRLAADPLAPDGSGGMPRRAVDVRWEVAEDERFRRVVRRGTAVATPEWGHAVHPEVWGLRPDREYYYRFRVGSRLSPVGRTKTTPARGARVNGVAFAFVSCQAYEDGYYAAYRHLARDDLDFALHLGDYIYEGAPSTDRVRQHSGDDEPYSLADYRVRHAQYKTDPDLQAAHAHVPFVVTWDDHEIDNNWEGDEPQDPDQQSPEAFRRRRIAATHAYYEHMPLRRGSIPDGPDVQLYRGFSYGSLAAFSVLDGRQYRSEDGPTMLGPEQEGWLARRLDRSPARWNVVANQTIVAKYVDARGVATDRWDGFPEARKRLLDLLGRPTVRNPIVLSGDSHASWVNELKQDFDDPGSDTAAIEFGGPSITSHKPWVAAEAQEAALEDHPHVRYFDARRHGYVRCTVSPDEWRTDVRLLPLSPQEKITVPDREAPIERTVSWVVPAGERVVEQA